MAGITGENMELTSFVSDKNKNIKSVQFVIQTDSIHKAESEEVTEPEPESMNSVEKLLKLFGLY